MNDERLHLLIAMSARIDDRDLARLSISGAEQELLEKIMATPVLAEITPGGPARPRPTRTRMRLSLVAAAALLAVVAGSWLLPRGGGNPAFAAEAIKVAEANSRLLVDAPGWVVTQVDEFTAEQGEMTFNNGSLRLDVHWRASTLYEQFLEDRGHAATRTEIHILGDSAWMFRYDNTTDYSTILPPHGVNFLEIRGDLGSEQAYLDILAALKPVDVETWLSALPASAIEPQERPGVVAEMLRGIPLPEGFDPATIGDPGGISERYQVGADVTGAVTCAWIELWQAAVARGDQATAQAAITAMQTSRSWPILVEMNTDGDYPETVWKAADLMASRSLPSGWAEAALGCGDGAAR